jgi:hypothetical protein
MKKLIYSLASFLIVVSLLLIVVSTTSCTKNYRVKHLGGKMVITLEVNMKLVNATWKDHDLWILTTPMNATDVAKQYKFIEKSSRGVLQGEITFIESNN